MASYHFAAQIISRGKGRSAIAAAAYRAGARLENQATGHVSDYSRRHGIAHAEIMAPEGADARLNDRAFLWNHVEAIEKRKDAQLAREINMALPHELDDAGRLALVRAYVADQFVARGMVADFAIHKPVPEKGDDPRNHHAHIMLTLRQVDVDTGLFFRTKTREWNADAMLVHWRGAWAVYQNAALARQNVNTRVDHRTLKAQRADAVRAGDHAQARGLDRKPEIHVGPQARAAARRGYKPRSREREVNLRQTSRKASGGRQSRPVAYPAIDRGKSRFEANVARIDANVERLTARLAGVQIRQQRWRRQLAWLDEADFAQMRAAERETWMRQRQRERDFVAILRFIGSPIFAARRKQRLARTVAIEDTLVGHLLGLKNAHLKRRRELTRSVGNDQAFGRTQRRGRART